MITASNLPLDQQNCLFDSVIPAIKDRNNAVLIDLTRGDWNVKCTDVIKYQTWLWDFVRALVAQLLGDALFQNSLSAEHIEKIVAAHGARHDNEKYARVVPFEEIAENGFNLNISRYVDTFEVEDEIDVVAVQKEIVELETELAAVKKKMAGYLMR